MDERAAATAITRARKRFAHSIRQAAEAKSERAQHRHKRRLGNARRLLTESLRTFEQMTLTEA